MKTILQFSFDCLKYWSPWLTILLLVFCVGFFSSSNCKASDLTIFNGEAFTRPLNKWPTPGYRTTGILIKENNVYFKFKDIEENGRYLGIGAEVRTSHFRGYIGGGRLSGIDSSYISGHWQFDVGVGIILPLDKYNNIVLGWEHMSNCAHICRNLFTAGRPNIGYDWIVVGIEYKGIF